MSEYEPIGNIQAVSVADTMRLAETYPTVALRTLFLELSRAQQDVPLDADDRADAIASNIRLRLADRGHLPDTDRHLSASPTGPTRRRAT